VCGAELIVQGDDAIGEREEEGGPFIAAVLGLNPLTIFFVPVTREGYKVDLASLFGHIDISHSSVVSCTI